MIEIIEVGNVERNLIKCTFFLCIVQCGRLCHWERKKEFLSPLFPISGKTLPVLNFILVC